MDIRKKQRVVVEALEDAVPPAVANYIAEKRLYE